MEQQIDLNALNTIFTLARMKQVELAPQDEDALKLIISIKAVVFSSLAELSELKKANDSDNINKSNT
jgi:hypothetical protein